MTTPWMKFYPSDWQSDPMLRCCSIAARGLWVEMMCLMHKADPYGSLLVNGVRVDKRKLSVLVGISEKDCTALLMEIEGNGVFSRDDDGTIYSRRMRRDHERSEEGRKQIAKRWDIPNRSPNRSIASEPITQKLEARDQIPEKKETRTSALVDDGWPKDYREQFWNRYPNKVGKPKALAKLDVCRKRGALWVSIMDGLERYIREKPADRAWLNPETFLNQERWTDQPAKPDQRQETAPITSEIDWDAVLTSYKKFGHWSKQAGPDLESPACRAPLEMLAKYGLLRAEAQEVPIIPRPQSMSQQ